MMLSLTGFSLVKPLLIEELALALNQMMSSMKPTYSYSILINITHLLFTDYSFLFFQVNDREARVMKFYIVLIAWVQVNAFKEGKRWKIGDGSKVCAWYNNWLRNDNLQKLEPAIASPFISPPRNRSH